jgi:hypothetical protein
MHCNDNTSQVPRGWSGRSRKKKNQHFLLGLLGVRLSCPSQKDQFSQPLQALQPLQANLTKAKTFKRTKPTKETQKGKKKATTNRT